MLLVDQELANFFNKGPDSDYFKLCKPCSVCLIIQHSSCSMNVAKDNTK